MINFVNKASRFGGHSDKLFVVNNFVKMLELENRISKNR